MKSTFVEVALAVAMLGCSSDPAPVAKEEAPPSAAESEPQMSTTVQLAGTEYDVVSIRGKAITPGPDDREATVAFVDEGSISFTGGCNRFNGPYTYDWPEGLKVGGDGPGFAATRMACPAELMQQDEALADALKAAAKILPTDDGKKIVDADGAELVILRRAAPA